MGDCCPKNLGLSEFEDGASGPGPPGPRRRILAVRADEARAVAEEIADPAEPQGEGGDDPVRLERTLTDGYARALSLEAERRRLRAAARTLPGPWTPASAARREVARPCAPAQVLSDEAFGAPRRPARPPDGGGHSSPSAPSSRPPRRVCRHVLDDSGPHGVDRRLDPVFFLQLHQDVRDVVLDRLRADVELGGDLALSLPFAISFSTWISRSESSDRIVSASRGDELVARRPVAAPSRRSPGRPATRPSPQRGCRPSARRSPRP